MHIGDKIDLNQHGSLKGKSTTSQLLVQMETIMYYMEDGQNCEIIYLDFSKAYNRVDHKILLSKLEKMGICDKTLGLIRHWLTNRRQRVKVGEALSDWDDMVSGIPQGSVLGPLLFIFFIWDLKLRAEDLVDPKIQSRILKYIDDSKLIACVKTVQDVESLQEHLQVGESE